MKIVTTIEDLGLCPICNKQTHMILTCHTFFQNGHWAACMPCDSAWDIHCEDEDCLWPGYIWGLNPKNPRSRSNEMNRPIWLIGDNPPYP